MSRRRAVCGGEDRVCGVRVAETPFAAIKEGRAGRRFLRRGLDGVTVEWDRIALTYNVGRLLAWARHEAQRSGASFMNLLQPSSTPLWALAAGELAMTNDRRAMGPP